MITAITRPELYQHWNEALNDRHPAVEEGSPKCGFYKKRKYKNGPWLPIAIWKQQEVNEVGKAQEEEYFVAMCDGQEVDPVEIWSWCKPITEAAFNHLTDPQPDAPIETLIEAGIDLNEAESIF